MPIHVKSARPELELYYLRWEGRALRFQLRPRSGLYRRRGFHGQWVWAVCFHGFRDFIRGCFQREAYRVQTAFGDWHSGPEFEADLPRLAEIKVGSIIEPIRMIDLCDHGGIDADVRAWRLEKARLLTLKVMS